MTDPVEQKEWAEGLRDRLVNAIAAAVCREDEKPDDERTLDWGSTDDLACVAADAVLAVVEPRVISLAGEVETAEHRVKLLGQAIGEFLVASGGVMAVDMTGPEVLAHLEMLTAEVREGRLTVGQPVPEGMTAEKLLIIADWLDTYDRMAAKFFDAVEKAEGFEVPFSTRKAAEDKDVQNDLRAWAAALSPLPSERKGP